MYGVLFFCCFLDFVYWNFSLDVLNELATSSQTVAETWGGGVYLRNGWKICNVWSWLDHSVCGWLNTNTAAAEGVKTKKVLVYLLTKMTVCLLMGAEMITWIFLIFLYCNFAVRSWGVWGKGRINFHVVFRMFRLSRNVVLFELCRSGFILRIVGRRLFAIMSRSDHHRSPFEGIIPSAPAEPYDPCKTKTFR